MRRRLLHDIKALPKHILHEKKSSRLGVSTLMVVYETRVIGRETVGPHGEMQLIAVSGAHRASK